MQQTTFSPCLSEIRILTVKDFYSEICTLEKVSLLQNPQYEALSYTWSGLKDTQPIRINDETAHVPANLEAALRHLRAGENIKLWVDAVCINQNDKERKNTSGPADEEYIFESSRGHCLSGSRSRGE
jgi:hypothetical protein